MSEVGDEREDLEAHTPAATHEPAHTSTWYSIGKASVMINIISFVLAIMGLFVIDRYLFPGTPGIGGLANRSWELKHILWGVLLAIALVIFIVFAASRGEKNEKRKRLSALELGGIKKRLNSLLGFTRLLRESPEGREPQIFSENRLLLQCLANYTTRSEITYRYWKTVSTAIEVGKNIIPSEIGKFSDQEKLRNDLIAYRSEGFESERGTHVIGWNRMNLRIVDLLNRYFELVFMTYTAANFKLKETNQFKFEASEFTRMQAEADEIAREMADVYKTLYKPREKAYGAHFILKAYKNVILNMSNVTGDVLEHPMKFARPGAKFVGGAGYFGPAFEAKSDARGLPVHEVNQYGQLISDRVDQELAGVSAKDWKKPRQLENPKDIIDYPDFIALMNYITLDWKGLAEDIRYGLHHPQSRTAKAYVHAIEKNIFPEWNDAAIKPVGRPSTQDQAFDMRALANPGRNVYWGRKKFMDQSLPPDNPDPNLTSLGLKIYLEKRIELDMKDKHKAHEFLLKYPADTGVPYKNIIKGDPRNSMFIGGYLGQKEEGK